MRSDSVSYVRSHRSTHSSSSERSYGSSHTQSTAPTIYSDHRPVIKHYNTTPGRFVDEPLDYRDDYESPAPSTIASEEDLNELSQYCKPSTGHEVWESDAIASTPSEFAELFPSERKLIIKHDDSSSDGNMNLRIDTEVEASRGRVFKMTLFHLKMQDLRERKFSLRRYCRESGRELCSSSKKYTRPETEEAKRKRPSAQRSLTSTLQSFGAKAVPKSLRRRNSGYESDEAADLKTFTRSNLKATVPTDTIKMEFSNYAHVEVNREKTKTEKHYSFEYWGMQYYWRRELQHSHRTRQSSYQLLNVSTGKLAARITPEKLSKAEHFEEVSKGGWCPPCTMVISDGARISHDLADVIVATGLVALVDDSIKRHWRSKDSMQLHLPGKGTQNFVPPERIINEAFDWRVTQPYER